MKKLILISSLLVFFSACGLKSDSDFAALYQDHVHAKITAVEDLVKSLGFYKQEQSQGTLQMNVEVPVIMSGSLALEHSAKVNGRDTDISLKNIRLAYESMMGSGSLDLEKFGFISKEGDLYVTFDGLKDNNLLTEDIRNILMKYTGQWLSWTKKDAQNSLAGATPEEILSNTIAENLMKMSLQDVEEYLTKYPIWRDTADLGMSGSFRTFAVDLDRKNLVTLIDQVSRDITSSGITDEQKQELTTQLDLVAFSGTIGFDKDDAGSLQLHLIISGSGMETSSGTSAVLAQIDITATKNQTLARIVSPADNSDITLTFSKTDTKSQLDVVAKQDGDEMGKISGYVDQVGDRLKELNLDISAQGVAVSLRHTNNDDHTFVGKLQLPVGALSWDGGFAGSRLSKLSLKGTTPVGAISMDLSDTGDKIVGPLIVKEGTDVLLNANVSLLIDTGKLGLAVDVMNPEGTGSTTPQAHFGINMTHTNSPFTNSINTPSGSKSLQALFDELNTVTTLEDSFTEELDSPVDIPESTIPLESFDTESISQ